MNYRIKNMGGAIGKLQRQVAELEAKVIDINAMLKVTSDSTENKKESEVAVCEQDKHDFEGVNNGYIRRCKKCGMETM